jgi:hypothetical protein
MAFREILIRGADGTSVLDPRESIRRLRRDQFLALRCLIRVRSRCAGLAARTSHESSNRCLSHLISSQRLRVLCLLDEGCHRLAKRLRFGESPD